MSPLGSVASYLCHFVLTCPHSDDSSNYFRYALPYRVTDALVFHFYRFASDTRDLPVLWHQCLLVFVVRYKEDITSEQKEALLELLRKHKHHSITEDIRREIVYSRSRDKVAPMENDPAIAFVAASSAKGGGGMDQSAGL